MSKPAVKVAFENVLSLLLRDEIPNSPPAQMTATRIEIASLANLLWEQRGRPVGDPERDWYEAERQLRMRNAPRFE